MNQLCYSIFCIIWNWLSSKKDIIENGVIKRNLISLLLVKKFLSFSLNIFVKKKDS